jgi:small-conductance mechanosensitive channel
MDALAPLFAWGPPWLVSLSVLIGAAALAYFVHMAVFGAVKRMAQSRDLFVSALVQRTRGPGRLALMIVALSLASNLAPITETGRLVFRQGLLIAFIVLVGWVALTALHIWSVIYSRRFKVDVEDNLSARKHVTQIHILERTASVFIGVLTLAAALMTLDAVRQYGVTLLASAGAAGIIAGLALQPLLTNLIAGIQIAVTQPIRIDDAVLVEGEMGWVEEIGATYVVVKLWDLRRMVLPLSYFIQNPFQNWTRESAALIGTVMLYVDYTAPIEAMRAKLTEILRTAPEWDGKVENLAVTEVSERTLQVRCLVSARNAGETFDLRARVREAMIAWLVDEHPDALPRERRAPDVGWTHVEAPERSAGRAGAA